MLTPTDPTQAAALDTALGSVRREAYAILRFDWNQDGGFSHLYSDLSEMASDVSVDRSHASSLPDNVNAVSGFTSAQLTATIGGSLMSGISAKALFDPFSGDSPLIGFSVVGTPVSLVWRVRTEVGDIDTPGFTGYVSSFQFNRVEGTVAITGVDNYDMTGASVTLPRWAAQTTSPRNEWWENTEGTAMPISGKWVLYEVLRQLGRSPIVEPEGGLSYQSMIGSVLPSFSKGTLHDHYQLQGMVNNTVYYKTAPDGWHAPDAVDLYSGTTKHVLDKLSIGTSTSSHSTQAAVYIPDNGSAEPEQDLVFRCRTSRTFSSNNTSRDSGYWSSTFYLEDFRLGERPFVSPTVQEDPYLYPAQMMVQELLNGQIWVYIHENWATGFKREWSWTTVGKIPLSTDLNTPTEVWVKLRFLNSNLVPEVRFDGAVQTLTADGTNVTNVGVRRRPLTDGDTAGNGSGDATDQLAGRMAGQPRNGRTNMVLTNALSNQVDIYPNVWGLEWWAPAPGAQASYAYRPAFPLLANGKPKVSFRTRTAQRDLDGWLYYLPEVNGREGWSVLKDVVDGFRGTMFTDEWGTLHIGDASWAQFPALPSTYQTLTLDSLNEVSINPTEDNRRNNVILNGQFRGSTLGFVYDQQGSQEKSAMPGDTKSVVLPMSTDTVMFNKRLPAVSNVEPTTDDAINIRTGRVSAAPQDGVSTVPGGSWQAGMASLPGEPRFFKCLWNESSGSYPQLYIGSYLNGNASNWKAAGRYLTDAVVVQGTASDSASIADLGTRTLSMDTTEWLQSGVAGGNIAGALLTNLTQETPIVSDLETPADPRRQVFDVIKVVAGADQDSGATFFAQILSKTTRWSGSEYTDTLSLRLFANPGVGIWDQGLWDTATWGA